MIVTNGLGANTCQSESQEARRSIPLKHTRPPLLVCALHAACARGGVLCYTTFEPRLQQQHPFRMYFHLLRLKSILGASYVLL